MTGRVLPRQHGAMPFGSLRRLARMRISGWNSRTMRVSAQRCLASAANKAEAAAERVAESAKAPTGALSTAYGHVPPPAPGSSPAWTDGVWTGPVDVRTQIFCNRSLNMKQIKAVGFDMDYTLAQYRPAAFEAMAYNETVNKLVSVFGYPQELYAFDFDWQFMMRGLVIDKRGGNVLKVDRHKYVKIAYHGFRKLESDERNALYHRAVRDSFDEPDYSMIDTLFSLAEAYLFMQLVELKDRKSGSYPLLQSKQYTDLYRDVRASVDLCHRDGSLKRRVAANPGAYIHDDPLLPQMLEVYKRSGRKIFLATNSLYDYTNVVMNYLLTGKVGKDRSDDWLNFFDVVITGCGKPAFFSSKQQLFAIDTDTGFLQNTDNGAPIVPIGEEDLPSPAIGSSALEIEHPFGERASVFQGGNYVDLHKMLGVQSGSEVLYVGDHIYGDILRSKKSLGWRTMLVVPELVAELQALNVSQQTRRELRWLRQVRDDLDDQIQRTEWAFEHGRVPEHAAQQNREALANLRQQRDDIKQRHRETLQLHHHSFHPIWGQLLKTGYQNSRFAHQVERFACLYTSHVSNMVFYSPDKSYGGRMDRMAHEDLSPSEDPDICELRSQGEVSSSSSSSQRSPASTANPSGTDGHTSYNGNGNVAA